MTWPIRVWRCPVRSAVGSVLCPSPEKAEMQRRQVRTRRGTVDYERAAAAARLAGGSFSPADERLKLGSEDYSPGLLRNRIRRGQRAVVRRRRRNRWR